MPTLQVSTTQSKSVWRSPDGQREIFEVELDYNGTPVIAKTYSKDISVVGWSGSVETYEKEGKPGMPSQTFVKQPAKEGGYGGGGGGRSYAKPQGDNYTMYLSYAKDLAGYCIADGKFSSKLFAELLDQVSEGGKVLYEARPGAVETPEPKPETKSTAETLSLDDLAIEDEPWQKS